MAQSGFILAEPTRQQKLDGLATKSVIATCPAHIDRIDRTADSNGLKLYGFCPFH